tara:strand:- start:20 stop:187 length:168 start_codon:yes stop_codon:yes gene_type:complete
MAAFTWIWFRGCHIVGFQQKFSQNFHFADGQSVVGQQRLTVAVSVTFNEKNSLAA